MTYNLIKYPNLLDKIFLTYEDIEKLIIGYNLSFLQVRNNIVEWGMAFPMFLTTFYKFIIENKIIPTQEEFFLCYVEENRNTLVSMNLPKELKIALKARIFRTYPSLVRDIHFAKYVKDQNIFDLVIYNEIIDVEMGLDLVVQNNSEFYGINLYTDTKRAYIGREKKQFRHKQFDNVKSIELPVDFKGSKKCGNFFLYAKPEFDKLVEIIIK